MKATPFYRRRPLLCALLICLMSSAVLLTVALAQLDYDQFRQRLAQELSQLLQQPVQIETLQLTYQQGLALNIQNLTIGDSKTVDIQIPQLTGALRLIPLLHGELLFDRVILTEPQFKLSLAEKTDQIGKEPAASTAGKLFNKFGLSMLTIRQATLELGWDQFQIKGIPPRIENLNLVLRGWETEQNGYLVVSGNLPEQKGQFTVETELPPPAQFTNWREHPLKVKAELKQLSRDLLPNNLRQQLPERMDISIFLDGSPASGARISGECKEARSGKQLLKAEGRWLSTEQTDSLQALRVKLHDVPLEGDLQISRTAGGTQWQGNLRAENVLLPPLLKQWNPPQANRLVAGTLKTAAVQFSGLTEKDGGINADQQFQYQGQLLLENGRWALTDMDHLEQISLEVKLDNQTLELFNGKAQLFAQDLAFQGEIHNWQDAPLFSLKIIARPEVATLQQRFQDFLPEALVLSGPVPAILNLEGNRQLIRGELQLDLDELQGQFDPLIIKQPKQTGQLALQGSWQPGQIDITEAKLDFVDAHISGTAFSPLGEQSQPVRLNLNTIDLTALRPHSPLLQRLKAQGVLGIDLQQQAGKFQGELKLDQVGAHLIWILGDINSASGTATFNNQGLDFEKFNARLGKSAVQVDGKLRNWKNFLLELQVRSKKIRARDLIFANQEMSLYDLDGSLLINKGGIIFDPVHVRLKNGTDASVTGYVRNFSQPDTYLEIDSFQHADILEVINLFVGPPRKRPASRAATKPVKPVRILARAAQGTLGGLKFQQAKGMIVSQHDLFTLSPLRFKHKDGFCLSRVELDQGRLKISGHLEDFDANTLYREALHARGLINGTLRGDFYLEGNGTGEEFWASSRGGVHLEVRDGTLRKFRGLARLFSLLNVSQLFELTLPDMDRHGMPFTLATASVKLEDGVLSTKNLYIESNAMNLSLIGSRNIPEDTINVTVGVKPLRTVDKIITAIPVAGWLLAGEEKALITAHFKIEGPTEDPVVTAIPVSSISKTVLGLLKRTLGLPGTLISDPEKLFFPGRETAQSPTAQKEQSPPDPADEEKPIE